MGNLFAFAGVFIAVVSLVLSTRQWRRDGTLKRQEAHRDDRSAALEEALALAETRGEVIEDLKRQMTRLASEVKDVRDELEATRRDFSRALSETLDIVLREILAHLEEAPPNVQAAVRRIRRYLEDSTAAPRVRRF